MRTHLKYLTLFVGMTSVNAFASSVFVPYGFSCTNLVKGDPINWINDRIRLDIQASTVNSTNTLAGKLILSSLVKGQVVDVRAQSLRVDAISDPITAIPDLPIETLTFTVQPYLFTIIIPDPRRPNTGTRWTIKATGQARDLRTGSALNLACNVDLNP